MDAALLSKWVVSGMLIMNAVQDIRRKEIVLVPTIAAGVGGAVYLAVCVLRDGSLWQSTAEVMTGALLALLPGIMLVLLSVQSRGQIGAGDGIVVIAAGIWTGFPQILYIVTGGLWLAAFMAGILLLRRQKNREMPFVPVLLASYVILMLLKWI